MITTCDGGTIEHPSVVYDDGARVRYERGKIGCPLCEALALVAELEGELEVARREVADLEGRLAE